MTGFDDEIKEVIPSIFHVIGSSSDNQQSNECYKVTKFGIPDPAGASGSACTSLFLKFMYEQNKNSSSMTWWDLYEGIRSNLESMKFDQTPTFTSSRNVDVRRKKVEIVPKGSGKRRAVLIGINYIGQKQHELRSCQYDCLNIKNYLVKKEGFLESEMMILMDDGKHTPPTKENIQNAFVMLAEYSRAGDVNFVFFSGHGGQARDLDGVRFEA